MRTSTAFLLASAITLVSGLGLRPDNVTPTTPELTVRGLKVKRSCEPGSWKVTREIHTALSNITQNVAPGISGPSRILVTKPRRESWSNTMGLSFEEAKSLNTGLELAETVEDATEREVTAADDENGFVAFTTMLYCESGTATCNGQEISGDICTPRIFKGDTRGIVLDGVWNVVRTS